MLYFFPAAYPNIYYRAIFLCSNYAWALPSEFSYLKYLFSKAEQKSGVDTLLFAELQRNAEKCHCLPLAFFLH
jgi:hypothetical protein